MGTTDTDRPLADRVALVTGVSRARGIGLAVTRRLHALGATVVATGWSAHDEAAPWGSDPPSDPPVPLHQHDLGRPDAPRALVDEVVDHHGGLDIVVACHARSSAQSLAAVTADELDRSWAVNVRSVVVLARRFTERHDPTRPGGRMVWFTSGQHLGPMPDALPYALTKAALHEITPTLAAALAPAGIAAVCVNPGPVDTGWATAAEHGAVATGFPSSRWTEPDEIAALVAFLVSDEGAVLAGRAIDAEHGFQR
ncbi:MAG: SDR family oxidoreductase [Acidimicrobiales bacterium]